MNDLNLSFLSTRTAQLQRGDRTALIRCATSEDFPALARLLERSYFPSHPTLPKERISRRGRIRSVGIQLHKPMSQFLVVELDGSLCATNYFRIERDYKVFSSNGAISPQGREFDSRLVFRMAEHFVNCCQAANWPELKFFANFENEKAAQIFGAYFTRMGMGAKAGTPQLSLRERVKFGIQRHLICIRFGEKTC